MGNLGTVFVELDMDPSRYTRAQQRLYKDATQTSLNIEENFKKLGIKSAAEFDLMRAKANNSFSMIANSSKATANDIIRAEKAKNEQLKWLNEQQYGVHNSLMTRMKNNWKTYATIAVGAVIGIGYTFERAMAESLKSASDMNETVSKSRALFGDLSSGVEKWASVSSVSMGLSKQAALEQTATLGNMYKQLGAGTKTAIGNSEAMVTLAADVASFHNVAGGAEAVLLAMQSAFRGEYDALQRYIPTINAAAVQEQALAMTHKTNASELTNLEKALAAQAIITRDAGDALGDFARTSDQYANASRIAEARTKDISAAFGRLLLPYAKDAVNVYNALAEKVLNFAHALEEAEKVELRYQIAQTQKQLAGKGYTADMGGIGADFTIYGNTSYEVKQLNKNLETLKSRLKELETPAESAAKGIKNTSGAVDILTSSAKEGAANTEKYFAKLSKEQFGLNVKEAQKQADAMRKIKEISAEDEIKIKKLTADAILGIHKSSNKDEGQLILDRSRDLKDMYNDLKEQDGSYYQRQKGLLNQRAVDYLKSTKDELLVAQWLKNEKEKLLIEEWRSSDDFIKGAKAGFKQLSRDQYTWGQAGYDTVLTFSKSSTSALSEFLNFTKDGFLDFRNLGENIFNDMVDLWSQMLAKMIDQWLMSGIAGLFTDQGFSGFSLDSFLGNAAVNTATGGGGGGAGVSSIGAAGTMTGLNTFSSGAGEGLGSYAAMPTAGASTVGTGTVATGTGAGTVSIGGVSGSAAGAGGVAAGALAFAYGTYDFWSHWGDVTGPSALEYIQAYLKDLPAVPGWESSPPGSGGYGYQDMMSPYIFRQWLPDMLWGVNHSTEAAKDPYFAELANKIYNREVGIDEIAKELSTAPNYWIDPTAHAMGGVLKARDMLMPTKGGEGLFSGQPGEGVVSHRGMKALEKLNSGGFFGKMRVEIPVSISGKVVTRAVAEFGSQDVEYIKMTRRITN